MGRPDLHLLRIVGCEHRAPPTRSGASRAALAGSDVPPALARGNDGCAINPQWSLDRDLVLMATPSPCHIETSWQLTPGARPGRCHHVDLARGLEGWASKHWPLGAACPRVDGLGHFGQDFCSERWRMAYSSRAGASAPCGSRTRLSSRPRVHLVEFSPFPNIGGYMHETFKRCASLRACSRHWQTVGLGQWR